MQKRLDSDVNFLVDRKFPLAYVLKRPFHSGVTQSDIEQHNRDLQEIEDYRKELWDMDDEQFSALLSSQRASALAQYQAKVQLEEQQRFFNQPGAVADFVHWSKAAHWTLDEAVALSFGKAPEVVSWGKVKSYVEVSQFAREYGRVRDLALRAVPWKKLFDPVMPSIFLSWAKETDISFPLALEKQLNARGALAINWKQEHDKIKAELDAHVVKHRKMLASATETLAQQTVLMRQTNDDLFKLRELVQELELRAQEKRDVPETAKDQLPTRSRESLLKLVVGMAVGGYRYDPAATKNTAIKDISTDLHTHGVGLDPDTIRKWIQTGIEEVLSRNDG